jgi:phasin family protein
MTQSIGDLSAFSREIADTALKSAAAVSKGAQAIAAEATDYSRWTLETGSAALEKLVAARSLDKAVEVQTEFARAAYEGFVSEATKLTELYADMARDAFKPFESVAVKRR